MLPRQAILAALFVALSGAEALAETERTLVPDDTCIIEIEAPAGATVAVDGRDFALKRVLNYNRLKHGQLFAADVDVRWQGGEQRHTVIVQGGRRIHVRVNPNQADRPELVLQTGHTDKVRAVAFSPDGHLVLTGSDDNTAILWDVATGRQLRVLAGHGREVSTAAISPDGRRALTGSEDKTAILWDLRTGEIVKQFSDVVADNSICFSPKGHAAAAAGYGRVRIFDTATGTLTHFIDEFDGPYEIAFSPSGSQLAIAGDLAEGYTEHKAREFPNEEARKAAYDVLKKTPVVAIWDLASESRVRTFYGHKTTPFCVAFSPDGRWLASGDGSEDSAVILWDVEAGTKVRSFVGHAYQVNAVAFSPDGETLLTGSDDYSAALWEVRTGERLCIFSGHTGKVWSAAFSPDGRQVLTGSLDGTANLYDAATAKRMRSFAGNVSRVSSAALSSSDHLLAGTNSGSVAFWEMKTGQPPAGLRPHSSGVSSAAFDANGTKALTGSSDGTALYWEVRKQEILWSAEGAGAKGVGFGDDGRRLVAAGKRSLTICDTNGWKTVATIPLPSLLQHFAISGDGRVAATACGLAKGPIEVSLWDVAEAKKLSSFMAGPAPTMALTLNQDGGKLFIATGNEGDCRGATYRTATGESLGSLESASKIAAAQFSPDGHLLATSGGDRRQPGEIAFWHVETLAKSPSLPGQFEGAVLAFDKTATLLASAGGKFGEPGVVTLWDFKTRAQRHAMTGHTNRIRAIAITADGRYLVTGSAILKAASQICIWDAASGGKTKEFPVAGMDVNGLAVSHDGKHIAYGTSENVTVVVDAETGKQVYMLGAPAAEYVMAGALSPDGHHALVGRGTYGGTYAGIKANEAVSKGQLLLHDAATGNPLRVFSDFSDVVRSVAFSPDSRSLLVGYHTTIDKSVGSTNGIWELSTGTKIAEFDGPNFLATPAAFSVDGKLALSGAWRLWDVAAKKKVSQVQGHGAHKIIWSVAVDSDGTRAVTGAADGTAILWDLSTGRQLIRFEGHTSEVYSVALSRARNFVATGSADGTAAIWNASSGTTLRRFETKSQAVNAVAFSPDDRQLLLGTVLPSQVLLYDVTTGSLIRSYKAHTKGVATASFSPDGGRILTGSGDQLAIIWDTASGRILHKLSGHTDTVRCAEFSPDGKKLVTGSPDKTAIIWDAETGKRLRTITRYGAIHGAEFSPDSKQLLLCAGMWTHPELWDVENGNLISILGRPTSFQDGLGNFCGAYIRANGNLLIGSYGKAVLWDLKTKAIRQVLQTPAEPHVVVLHPSGRYVLMGSSEGVVSLCDAANGVCMRSSKCHTGSIDALTFTADGRIMLTGSHDGTLAAWDFASGEELVRMALLNEGNDWLAFTREGLFDGSEGGRQMVSWRVGGELNVVPVDRFFQDFYHPGLVAEIWGGGRPLPKVRFGDTAPPRLAIVSPRSGEADRATVTIQAEAVDQGGGISNLAVYQNDSRVLASGTSRREGRTLRKTFELGLVEGENRIRLSAASGDGAWEAEPAEIVLHYSRPLAKSELYVLAVGVSKYADANLHLKYAAIDAKALADLFRRRGGNLYNKVHVTTLLDEQGSRTEIRNTLKSVAAQTRPQDTLVLFLAGHGSMVGQRYYFVPHELRKQAETLDDDLRSQALPADELSDFLGGAKALKRVLILDTCASGGALGPALRGRSGFALRGAIERLSRAQGVFTIAAAASTEEAQESRELGHGLLTYALLAGLKAVDQGPLRDRALQPSGPDRVADVLDWFTFAAGQVPRLTEQLFGVSQDVQTSIEGSSFPVLPLDD
ncbi:MAG TPA: PQQ-binding-like beta-propeller repeat protein [Pirellulales bacterium]|nr:PQQ-binding-like beta-propeller repeat protein [Pirellulales bacterium]